MIWQYVITGGNVQSTHPQGMVSWLALLCEIKESIQFHAKMGMNLCSLPRCSTIALVKTGVMSGGPKCHGPIVEVGSHIIIIVIIVIVIFTIDTGKSKL